MAELTVVFADLAGSTGLYEVLGNAKAAEVVSRATQWMGKLSEVRGGKVIRYLGDGALIAFDDATAATNVAIEIQRLHRDRLNNWPADLKSLKIKIGLAQGSVLEQDGDYFGQPVHLAATLCELAGPDQILASPSVVVNLYDDSDIRFRNLGLMNMRGKAPPSDVFSIEWRQESASNFMTVEAQLETGYQETAPAPVSIDLQWGSERKTYVLDDMPITLGRSNDANFWIDNRRVSRMQARLERRGNKFVLIDTSTYGTWVRFADNLSVISLRRNECVLLSRGELAMGSPFDDASTPVVKFTINDSFSPSGLASL
jgi:class 3 adenylate cyclase